MTKLRWMQSDGEFDFELDGVDYIATYVYDAEIGKSWLTTVYTDEPLATTPEACLALPSALLTKALQEMENDGVRQAERAAEQAFSDYHGGSGPMSMQEQANRDWMEKRSLRR